MPLMPRRRIGIGGVDVDGRERGTDRHGERERCDSFLII